MSYIKSTWQDGDVITTEKLNNIESGIESSLSNELLALYKTMAGKDWPYDPNPTDAEVIDKIAADASGSGGEEGGGRLIDFEALDPREEESGEDVIYHFSGYEAGLSAKDFINSWETGMGKRGELTPFLSIGIEDGLVALNDKYYYNPETGEISCVVPGGSPK